MPRQRLRRRRRALERPRAARTRPTRNARQRRHARNAIRRRANFRTTNRRPDQRMSDQHAASHSNAKDESARRRTLCLVLENILDKPPRGLSAWLRTTAGVVALLFALQLVTGLLLAFYYVPSADSAYTTVAYVEKVVPAGSWIRALHFYGSQMLPAALVLH